jgi:hypothetical protein
MGRIDTDEVHVEPSGWFAVQLRYAYLSADESDVNLVEDRVILVDGTDEEAALGRAVEMAPDYEDDYETDDGEPGVIRFEGIVAIKELDDPPAAGVYPEEMAFPRARDD